MNHPSFSFHATAVAALLLTTGCATHALDLGDDQPRQGVLTPPLTPPRTGDGSIDETVPWIVVPGEVATQLVVDASRLYWSSFTGVKGCRIDDCLGTIVTYEEPYESAQQTSGLAVSPTRLYWGHGSSVLSCPLDGCTGAPSVIDIMVPATPRTLALDETHVYFAADDETIQRCPLSGCIGKPELVAVGGSGMVADGSSIYVGASDTSLTVSPDPSGSPRALFSRPGVTFAAVDAERVYWADSAAGTVLACPHSGCQGDPFVLASGQNSPAKVLVDDRNAYWIEKQNPSLSRGRIFECPLSGCGSSPKILASDQPFGGAFAQDEGHLYWAALYLTGSPENHPNVNRIGK